MKYMGTRNTGIRNLTLAFSVAAEYREKSLIHCCGSVC